LAIAALNPRALRLAAKDFATTPADPRLPASAAAPQRDHLLRAARRVAARTLPQAQKPYTISSSKMQQQKLCAVRKRIVAD